MSLLKKNFFYSFALTLSNYIFPLITYPYASRVLGVNSIGICNFVDSIINYTILFAMMGTSYVALREVARHKNDRITLNQIFSNLFWLNFILCIIALLFFNLFIFFNPDLLKYRSFLLCGELKIILNVFLLEWLFQGLEDFKYITIRSILVKSLYVALLFILVRNETDIFIYYLLSILLIGGNFLFNWKYKNKFVSLSYKNINFLLYLKPVLIMGGYAILTSVYATFNIMMLGFLCGTIQVGYYVTAIKILELCMGVFAALTKVMSPRISSLIYSKEFKKINETLLKIFDLLFIFSLPLICFCFTFSPEIVHLIAGNGYEGAILPMKLVIFLILPFGIDQILVLQVLMPFKEDKIIFRNTLAAAIIGLVLLITLVPTFGASGSAIVLLSSEIIIMLTSIYYCKKKVHFSFPFKEFKKRILYSIPYILICILFSFFVIHPIIKLILASFLFITWFAMDSFILNKGIISKEYTRIYIKLRLKLK